MHGVKTKKERGMGKERSELIILIIKTKNKKQKEKKITYIECRNQDKMPAENGTGKL